MLLILITMFRIISKIGLAEIDTIQKGKTEIGAKSVELTFPIY